MYQDMQCTYNVTLTHVWKLLLQWKSDKYYIFLCVCMCICTRACVRGYTGADVSLCACSLIQHAMRRILSSAASGSTTYFYVINGTIFGKTLLNIKCMFWLSLQLVFQTSSCKVHVIFVRYKWHVFERSWNIKFLQNPSSGSRVVACG